ncbi:MAG: M24 family metallopeptidase, partial [Duncaniella sp.]|nr:M24 family metallopeptidase [Duncaniella sp.]
GFGPNGAIVHYSATPETNATVAEGSLLLLDSGGNYLDATTDITRTIAIGKPTAEMRHDFTLVMKGHIAIATAIFPEGTRGHQLDAMARMPLWKEGKSYLHGTGHGVGLFLSCHEGPQSIRLNDTMAPLVPGMLTSNEPGLYLSGRYGIRCENLVLTVDHAETEFGKFYAFETVTLCPFDLSLFDTSIMTKEEIGWVDSYHARVRELLSPALNSEERLWLEAATKPLI